MHYILIVESQIGHLSILCRYGPHSGWLSATYRTYREGGSFFLQYDKFFTFLNLLTLFRVKEEKINHTNMYDDEIDVFEQFCNTLDTFRPVKTKIGHFLR